ncbi:unnamed protein product [Trichobilharzia szidati]|nr:unnamed protein product [Trichobilharzia szidati]
MQWLTISDLLKAGISSNSNNKSNSSIFDKIRPHLLAVVVFCIIGGIMTMSILLSRRLRMHYGIYIFSVVLAFLSWTVVVSIFCYQIGLIYSLISLALTLVAGGTAILLGFKSRRFTVKGYYFFFILPIIPFIIGNVFYILLRIYGFPFDILAGIFLDSSITLAIYLSTVWLKYSRDKTVTSPVFIVFLEFTELVALFLESAIVFCKT